MDPIRARIASLNCARMGARLRPDSVPTEIGKSRTPVDLDQLERLAPGVEALNASVLACQEVPNLDVLRYFVDTLLPPGFYPYIYFSRTNDKYDTHQAILSRFPIVDQRANNDPEFVRGLAEAVVDLGPFPLAVFDGHFKANPRDHDNHPEMDRAERTRGEEVDTSLDVMWDALQRYPNAEYVFAADCNAELTDRELRPLLSDPHVPLVDPMNGRDVPTHRRSSERIDVVLHSPGLSKYVVQAGVFRFEGRRGTDHDAPYIDLEIPRK